MNQKERIKFLQSLYIVAYINVLNILLLQFRETKSYNISLILNKNKYNETKMLQFLEFSLTNNNFNIQS